MSSIILIQDSGGGRAPDRNWPRLAVIVLLGLVSTVHSPDISAAMPPSWQQLTVEPPVDVAAEEHYQRALKLVARADESGARVEFRRAWEQDPGEDKYVQGLTMCYIHHQEFDQAAAVLKDNVARRGPTSLGYTLQGELFFVEKQYALAYESLGRALELSRNQGYRAHELIGLIYIEYRRYKEALEEFGMAAEQGPNSAQVRYYHGRMYYQNGNHIQARDEFTACLKLQPGYPRALENLGLCFEALQDFPKALDCYRQAIALEDAKKGRRNAEP
jgi:tetratricopeptide (TPR) repeat protein